MTNVSLAPVPSHIPQSLVRDVDTYNLPGSRDDQLLAMKKLQDESPDIFWTPHNGGHWVMTRGADLYPLFTNTEMFSNKRITIPATEFVVPGTGTMPILPIESDGDVHRMYRLIILPFFSPRHVQKMIEEVIRPLAIRIIEDLKPRGECEYIHDFAKQLPIIAFMDLMGLPEEDAEYLLPFVETTARDSDLKARGEALGKVGEYIKTKVEERRAQEQEKDDLMNAVVNATIDGRPATDKEIYGFCFNLLFGGLDTVASALGFIARFLADNPGHRQQLIDEPEKIPHAVEELLRRFGVGGNSKMVAKDCEYKGIRFKKGDMMWFAGGFHGLDEREYENPLEVDFDRQNISQNSTFGNGPHRCPGSFLARAEIRVFIEEWLARIPNFQVTPNKKPVSSGGGVQGMIYLPLSWEV